MSILDDFRSALQNDRNAAILHRLIAEAAYYKAEKRGFTPGFEEKDWLEAEKEIKKEFKSYMAGYYDFLYMH